MLAPIKPRSAAFLTSSRASFQSCFSSSSMCGMTSLSMNWRVVSAIMRCSSVKSSGVKTSAVVRSSIMKAPPWTTCFCSTTADIISSLLAFGLRAFVLNLVFGILYFDLCALYLGRQDQSPKTKVLSTKFKVLSSDPFKYSRGAHAAADAHRHHSITAAATLQLAQDRRSQLRASATEWMAQRNRSAVYIYLVHIQTEGFDHSQRLRR